MRAVLTALSSTLRFRTFVTLLVATELADDLRGDSTFDVFAPPDDVFARLRPGVLDSLFKDHNIEALIDLAEAHVVERGSRLVPPPFMSFRTLEAIRCTNGTIHVVDRVVIPSTFSDAWARRMDLVNDEPLWQTDFSETLALQRDARFFR